MRFSYRRGGVTLQPLMPSHKPMQHDPSESLVRSVRPECHNYICSWDEHTEPRPEAAHRPDAPFPYSPTKIQLFSVTVFIQSSRFILIKLERLSVYQEKRSTTRSYMLYRMVLRIVIESGSSIGTGWGTCWK